MWKHRPIPAAVISWFGAFDVDVPHCDDLDDIEDMLDEAKLLAQQPIVTKTKNFDSNEDGPSHPEQLR